MIVRHSYYVSIFLIISSSSIFSEEIDLEPTEKFAKGKALYEKQGCVSCHGINGEANTPVSKALKIESFVTGKLKHGDTMEHIVYSIHNGIPKTAMPGFKHIKGEQAHLIAEYILSLRGEKVDQTKPLKSISERDAEKKQNEIDKIKARALQDEKRREATFSGEMAMILEDLEKMLLKPRKHLIKHDRATLFL
jgi:cytochrome c